LTKYIKYNEKISDDIKNIDLLLSNCKDIAVEFLTFINDKKCVNVDYKRNPLKLLEADGIGTKATIEEFLQDILPYCTANVGPRWFGFVVGGVTPAALVGDWLASVIDQIPDPFSGSIAADITEETINYLIKFFEIENCGFNGAFTSGTSTSNLIAIITAREWCAQTVGIDVTGDGVWGLLKIKVFGACPHISLIKALGISGLGRNSWQPVESLPGREAIDPNALRKALSETDAVGKIVVASAGTVTTGDFDNLNDLSDICKTYKAWLHVDGAFGAFARCSKNFYHLVSGLEKADSISIDAHKWFNVPYDSGLIFTKHLNLQEKSLKIAASYLEVNSDAPIYANRVIQLAQRFRALPVWLTLKSYGYSGVSEIIERNCYLAKKLSDWIINSKNYELLSETRLNIVAFKVKTDNAVDYDKTNFINKKIIYYLNQKGLFFCSPSKFNGYPCIRVAICNWRTTEEDINIVTNNLEDAKAKIENWQREYNSQLNN
jgi:glutamate/tyrosine decarboxylase-like PLP-dependent enzyme